MVGGVTTAPPASAQGTAAGVVVGNGTISPGLGLNFQPETISFSGSLTGAGYANGSQTYVLTPCAFNGGSTSSVLGSGDNLAFGEGVMLGSCGNIAMTFTYFRVGGVIFQDGTGTVNGVAASHVGTCVWLPTSIIPVANYTEVCAWLWAAA